MSMTRKILYKPLIKKRLYNEREAMTSIGYQYKFYSVGQGLFSSGKLMDAAGITRFVWVYDCGTLSKQNNLDREIVDFNNEFRNEKIDMLCLSHFDEDHVNGVKKLLKKNEVKLLIMPYVPLIERIQIAFSMKECSNEFISFLYNPSDELFRVAAGKLGKVKYIAGSGSKLEQGDIDPIKSNDDQPWELVWDDNERLKVDDEELFGDQPWDQDKPAEVLIHNKPFTLGIGWEFMYYNAYKPRIDLASFRSRIIGVINKPPRIKGLLNRDTLIPALQKEYAKQFGKASTRKNMISLVMYSGPVVNCGTSNSSISCAAISVSPFPILSWYYGYQSQTYWKEPKISILYFGDLPLTSRSKIDKIRNHLNLDRWERAEVIQVPHHGAKSAWPAGTAHEFRHRISVISSRQDSKHHPAVAVLNDLKNHGIVRAHENQSILIMGGVTL